MNPHRPSAANLASRVPNDDNVLTHIATEITAHGKVTTRGIAITFGVPEDRAKAIVRSLQLRGLVHLTRVGLGDFRPIIGGVTPNGVRYLQDLDVPPPHDRP